MEIFADTNMLASAFGMCGLCADILRLILADHELVTGEVVIQELRRMSIDEFEVPAAAVKPAESLLRGDHVEPKSHELPDLKLRGRYDRHVVSSAVDSKAAVSITGDREIFDLKAIYRDAVDQGIMDQVVFEGWTRCGPRPRGSSVKPGDNIA